MVIFAVAVVALVLVYSAWALWRMTIERKLVAWAKTVREGLSYSSAHTFSVSVREEFRRCVIVIHRDGTEEAAHLSCVWRWFAPEVSWKIFAPDHSVIAAKAPPLDSKEFVESMDRFLGLMCHYFGPRPWRVA